MTIIYIAFRNLIQARRRSLLLGLAVAIVATLFLVLRAASLSVSERMIEAATTLSAGHVNVSGFFKARKKGSDPILADRTAIRTLVRKQVPEAVDIIDRHRGWGRLIGPGSSINVGLSGIVYEEESRFFESLRLAAESEYESDGDATKIRGRFEDLQAPRTILLFAAQAKKLEVDVGDVVTVVTEASGGQTNTVDLRVAAIASDIGFMSNWNVFVARQTILDLYGLHPESTGAVMIYLRDPTQAALVMERLRQGLSEAGYRIMDHDPKPFWLKFDKVAGEDWLGQKLDLTLWSDEISFVLWVTTALDLVSFFVVGILTLIVMGGIINSMWMAVRERTKEIGTMRAIGAQRSYIVRLFVMEAALLGLIASALGVTLGAVALLTVNALDIPIRSDGVRLFLMTNTLGFSLHPSQLVASVVLFTAITGIAALYPAFKAARMRPVDALMH